MATYTGADKRLQYLFEHGGGGGGSNVEANPQGTPTDWLNSLKVENTIYSVAKIGECYSTEERQVGAWYDGKPLYQITIITPFSGKTKGSRSYTAIMAGNQGLSPKVVFGTITIDNYNTFTMNGIGHDFADSSATNYAYATYLISNNSKAVSAVLRQYFYDGTASGYFTTTVQYTKDSDTAGSGIWTPSGAYAEHYGTEEQIIGTWLGKPLYRRIIPAPIDATITANSWVSTGIPVGNIKEITNGRIEITLNDVYSLHFVQFGMINDYVVVNSFRQFGITNNGANYLLEYTKTTD